MTIKCPCFSSILCGSVSSWNTGGVWHFYFERHPNGGFSCILRRVNFIAMSLHSFHIISIIGIEWQQGRQTRHLIVVFILNFSRQCDSLLFFPAATFGLPTLQIFFSLQIIEFWWRNFISSTIPSSSGAWWKSETSTSAHGVCIGMSQYPSCCRPSRKCQPKIRKFPYRTRWHFT